MNEPVKTILRCLAFLGVQVFILDNVPPLHRFLTPSLYVLFVFWLPFQLDRKQLLLIAMLYGMALDMFRHTPGLHASACTWVAFLRPYIINALMPRLEDETGRPEPSVSSMGLFPYGTYLALLTFTHHLWVVYLEWLNLGDVWYFLMKVLATTGLSLILMAVTEMLFRHKSSVGQAS